MQMRLKTALFLGLALAAPSAFAEEHATQKAETMNSVRPVIVQDSMNVYRRFVDEDREAMIRFYDEVLDLEPLQPIDLGDMEMILFKIGGAQIKLATGLKEDRQYHLGEVKDGTGIRLFTLYFPDEAALKARFEAFGAAAPEFTDIGDGARAALVKDPGGFTLKLVVAPDAPPETYEKVEVGVNAADLEESRSFYREFVGLDELPAVEDELLGVTKYPYRNGATTVNVWSAGEDLPADTGSAGMQYVVNDVDAVDAKARARNVTVETPLGGLPGFDLRFIWLNDPGGVTNYFAQVGGNPDN